MTRIISFINTSFFSFHHAEEPRSSATYVVEATIIDLVDENDTETDDHDIGPSKSRRSSLYQRMGRKDDERSFLSFASSKTTKSNATSSQTSSSRVSLSSFLKSRAFISSRKKKDRDDDARRSRREGRIMKLKASIKNKKVATEKDSAQLDDRTNSANKKRCKPSTSKQG
jgi:hypothetical protein